MVYVWLWACNFTYDTYKSYKHCVCACVYIKMWFCLCLKTNEILRELGYKSWTEKMCCMQNLFAVNLYLSLTGWKKRLNLYEKPSSSNNNKETIWRALQTKSNKADYNTQSGRKKNLISSFRVLKGINPQFYNNNNVPLPLVNPDRIWCHCCFRFCVYFPSAEKFMAAASKTASTQAHIPRMEVKNDNNIKRITKQKRTNRMAKKKKMKIF